MIHHISISANDPLRAAHVLAEIIGGQVVPAPPEFPEDSRFVLSMDDHGTMIEVVPYGTELRPGDDGGEFIPSSSESPYVACHAFVSVVGSSERILQIGEREGWLTRLCNRGPFELIECWIENRQLIEFATPEMTQQYVNFSTNPETLRDFTAQFQN